MSIVLFELKNEHIQLLKHLKWFSNNNKLTSSLFEDYEDNGGTEITSETKYEYIDLILNGKTTDDFNTEEIKEYSDEQKAEWDTLYGEMPLALDIILFNGHFELGKYKSKWHDRNWKTIK